jgi:hypothetical protein
MQILSQLIASFDPQNPSFRPTEIYNENWLTKIVLNQASFIKDTGYPLGFLPGSTWYSESQLPTAFKPRHRGDPLGESRTNADGVIGHIVVGKRAKVDLELERGARHFTVVESKIGSALSSGVTHARYFDQAARYVACMAEVMAIAGIRPASLDRLDFIVLAPEHAIRQGTFSNEMKRSSIEAKVKRRISEYAGELDRWLLKHFEPTLNHLRLHLLSWENAIKWISSHKPGAAGELNEFYSRCLQFN